MCKMLSFVNEDAEVPESSLSYMDDRFSLKHIKSLAYISNIYSVFIVYSVAIQFPDCRYKIRTITDIYNLIISVFYIISPPYNTLIQSFPETFEGFLELSFCCSTPSSQPFVSPPHSQIVDLSDAF
ncbi:hypothetical protein PGB90_006914 [Kerria lacca]